jgi:hypothetical protein
VTSAGPPPSGLIGAGAAWPHADRRLYPGSIVRLDPQLKLGVVRVREDCAVVSIMGKVEGKLVGEDIRIWPGQSTEHRGHRIHLTEHRPDGRPRPWIKVVCT